MKKSLLVLTAALTFGGLAAAQTTATASAPQVPTLTDVPAGHWAKDAIDKLVSRGIILGYPDGTFRGTQNLTRYEAAVIIARLLDQIKTDGMPGGVDAETLAALQNAIQELAADLAALGVRVTDLEENAVNKDDFARLEARVEELASSMNTGGSTGGPVDEGALANIQQQIDDLTARADDYDTMRADIDDNASSIAALNDLTVLLNQDILNLQDRLSAVEAAQADFVQRADFDNLSGRVGAIDTRVTKLEAAPKFSVSGSLTATYGRIGLVSGTTHFDVDRLTRQTFAGGILGDGDVTTEDTDDGSYTGGDATFSVTASQLTTASGKLTINTATVNFGVINEFSTIGDTTDTHVYLDSVSMDGNLNGQKFGVNYAAGYSKFKFNDYLFSNADDENVERRGIVATIEASQLPLAPKMTVVLGNAWDDGTLSLDGNYYGLRAEVNPAGAGTFAVNWAQNDSNRSALGADWDLKFGAFGVKGVYTLSTLNNPSLINGTFGNVLAAADHAFYTNATADLGMFKIGANYRAIDPQYKTGVADMSADHGEEYLGATGYNYGAPYAADSKGFGVAAATALGPVALGGFFDSRANYDGTDVNTNFGIAAGLKFRGLSLMGFYNSSNDNGVVVPFDAEMNLTNANPYFMYNSTSPYMGIADVPMAYSTSFGGILKHSGADSAALIKGLNFTVADTYFYSAKVNDLQVYGNYSGNVGILKVEPMFRYHLVTAPTGGYDGPGGTAGVNTTDTYDVRTYNTIKYGIKLSTQPLTGVPLQPSLYGNFVNRVTTLGSAPNFGAGASASELLGQAGITFNQFLLPNMKASVGYAYYQGFGLSAGTADVTLGSSSSGTSATYSGASDRIYGSPFSSATSPFGGDNFGASNGKLDGFTTQLDWLGLTANYGIFRYWNLSNNTTSTPTSIAHAFKVSYTFKF